MVEFLEITDPKSADFESAMEIYSGAFPTNERHPENVIIARVKQGLNQMYIGKHTGEIVFMALLWPLTGTNFILLDYMATGSRHKGRNIGSLFLENMRAILKLTGKYFILEVEDPVFGENKEERQKRVAFYKKNGAKELNGVKYILPAIQGKVATEMILMVLGYEQEKIPATLVSALVTKIYKELYGREIQGDKLGPPAFKSADEIALI